VVQTQKNLILIVDDHPNIREMVRFALEKDSFTTCEASNGAAALEMFHKRSPALVVLDVSMPELDGFEVCRQLRKVSKVPILFLSSRDEEIDRILGLELGGDDYLTKPFSPRELVARVKVILRRTQESHEPPAPTLADVTNVGPLTLDFIRCEARWQDHVVILTATEFNILKVMMRRPGKVWSRQDLMDQAWDVATHVSDRTIDSHVRRLRQKFASVGAEPVATVHGFGYRLDL
jgi:two-component system OmpR family response regulator